MSSSIRRGTLAATALALAVVTLSACAAGNDAQTLEVKPDNAAASEGSNVSRTTSTLTSDVARSRPSAALPYNTIARSVREKAP